MSKLSDLKTASLAMEFALVKGSRKLEPLSLLVSFFIAGLSGDFSLSNWALQLERVFSIKVSKQGLWKRLSGSYSNFLEQLLWRAIKNDLSSSKEWQHSKGALKQFNRVLIGDSTTLKLPDALRSFFKGNRSKGTLKSLAKIQAVFDLKSDRFVHMELGAYTKNDQAASGDILSLLQPGDLVIRDLGYFVLETITKILDAQCFLISKLRYGITLYHSNGSDLDLVKLLKNTPFVDRMILVGKSKIPLRIVVSPVDEETAAHRRRKAAKDRDKRVNHSEKYYFLLGYNIYITNLQQDSYNANTIHNLYGLRWRIETLFKSWKSHLKLNRMVHFNLTCAHRARILIYSSLLLSVLVQMSIYSRYCKSIFKKTSKYLSMIKLTQWMDRNPLIILQSNNYHRKIEDALTRHCCYEKRVKRKNFVEKMFLIKSLS